MSLLLITNLLQILIKTVLFIFDKNFFKQLDGMTMGSLLSFLDIEISRDRNHFITSVYLKPTFSEAFLDFDSFIPKSFKFGLVSTLIFTAILSVPV